MNDYVNTLPGVATDETLRVITETDGLGETYKKKKFANICIKIIRRGVFCTRRCQIIRFALFKGNKMLKNRIFHVKKKNLKNQRLLCEQKKKKILPELEK